MRVVRDLDGRVEPQPRDRARSAVGVAPEQVAARDAQRTLVRRDPRRLLARDAPAMRRRERAEPIAMTARLGRSSGLSHTTRNRHREDWGGERVPNRSRSRRSVRATAASARAAAAPPAAAAGAIAMASASESTESDSDQMSEKTG